MSAETRRARRLANKLTDYLNTDQELYAYFRMMLKFYLLLGLLVGLVIGYWLG
jgi:hypothetical protein